MEERLDSDWALIVAEQYRQRAGECACPARARRLRETAEALECAAIWLVRPETAQRDEAC